VATLEPVPVGGWVSQPVSLSTDQRMPELSRQSPFGSPEVWARLWDVGQRCLTRLNPHLAGLTLAPMEPVEWRSSDGLAIEGRFLTPPDGRVAECLSLVVDIQGRPSAVWGPTFHTSWHDGRHELAGAGCAVPLPNTRRSTECGAAFTAANRSDLGGSDASDLLSGAEWCVAQGVTNPDRLGVGGWSYSGFLTAWLIRHTDRVRAAICGAAVTKLVSTAGSNDVRRLDENRFPGPLHKQLDVS